MFYARPKKAKILLGSEQESPAPPSKKDRRTTRRSRKNQSELPVESEQENEIEESIRENEEQQRDDDDDDDGNESTAEDKFISSASALKTRGDNQFYDRVPALKPSVESVKKLYPVTNPTAIPDDQAQSIVKWQEELQLRKEILKKDPTYQFATLVAGDLGYASVESLVEVSPDWPAPRDRDPNLRAAVSANNGILSHGFLDFNPSFGAAVQNSYTDLEEWMKSAKMDGTRSNAGYASYNKLGNFVSTSNSRRYEVPPLEEIINTPGNVRNQFARLVSSNMKATDITATKQYRLKVAYERVMYERNRLLASLVRMLTEPSSKKRPYN